MKAQKFRKIISLVMAVCIVFTLFAVVPFSASAEVTSGTTGDCSWTLDGTHLTISGNGEMGNYDIYIRGGLAPWGTEITSVDIKQGVTNIGDSAFRGCTSLTSITIPDSVTGIGYTAFCDCIGLTSITIPDSVASIGSSAFSGCTNLTSIIIPDSVTSIEYNAFSGCTSLTSITIPDSVTSIDDFAFRGCTNLTSITIPDSVTYMGKSVLDNTPYYNNENNWTDGVLYIGNCLVAVKEDIVNDDYVIRTGTKCIAYAAFSGFTGLTSITIPNSVTSIGSFVFSGCTGLTSVIIGNGVTRIGDSAFYGCTSLTGITIPDSVANIGWGAFSGCTSLTSITIPDSVTSIGDWAFGNTAYYDNDNNWLDGVLYISNHLIGVKKDIVKGDYVIRQGTKSVNGNAFSGCEELTSVTIPDSVINIGYDAFHYCAKLTAIIVDENNRNYCSADGVLYTKDKSQLMLCPTKKRV